MSAPVLFREFFKKFPQEFSEMYVIKQIHKTLECAEKYYKKYKDVKEGSEDYHEKEKHIKYMCKAYWMLQAYFQEKGIDPASYN